MQYSVTEFDPSLLPFPSEKKNVVVIDAHNRLYRLLPPYILANQVEGRLPMHTKVLPSKASGEFSLDCEMRFGRIALQMGHGQCSFRSFDGEVFHAVYQQIGKPVGSDCGVQVLQNLILFSDGSVESLARFLSRLIELSEQSEEGRFICYSWHVEHSYWREETKIRSRPLASVVLPSSLKNRLVTDLEKFLAPRTKDFYNRNGIPYRRSYLFYGIPGTGKTSLVQALAGHFHRSVSFLMPTHPKMTDDSLREAINQIPDDTIVVFEDIDALFSADRENRVSGSALTFSGLLNALDGISNPNGQVFVLTTNLRDHLDSALIRNGRVDMHIEFTYALPEQMELMWTNFYPEAGHLAGAFSAAVTSCLEKEKIQVTTAALQHYFVTQMDATAEEALSHVSELVRDVRQNSSSAMLAAATLSSTGSERSQEQEQAEVKEGEGGVEAEVKGSSGGKKKSFFGRRKRRAQRKAAEAVPPPSSSSTTTISASQPL
eukprot:gene7371-8154_t